MKLRAGASWPDHGFIFTDATGEPLDLEMFGIGKK
jgi:hypothetical protein